MAKIQTTDNLPLNISLARYSFCILAALSFPSLPKLDFSWSIGFILAGFFGTP